MKCNDFEGRSVAEKLQPDFLGQIAVYLPHLIALRERLHRIPEVGLFLPATQRAIAEELRAIGLTPLLGEQLSSVTAIVRGALPGPVVLLRADMDALPLQERSDVAFAAENGAMHACGHDLHMAGLIGAAKLLTANVSQLQGTVILMFQPGEEGHGGAQLMLDEGVLSLAEKPVVAAYGLHVFPTGASGALTLRKGTIMAGSSRARIVIRGKGAHASTPELGLDPVPPLAQVVLGLQSLVTRQFSAHRSIVVTVTQLDASESPNVIADESSCAATIRYTHPNDESKLRKLIERFVRDTASAAGCVGSVEWRQISGPVRNEPVLTSVLGEQLSNTLGAEWVDFAEEPLMASEDFASVLEAVPGSFFFVNARVPERASGSLHVDDVVFDSEAIAVQAVALSVAAWTCPL